MLRCSQTHTLVTFCHQRGLLTMHLDFRFLLYTWLKIRLIVWLLKVWYPQPRWSGRILSHKALQFVCQTLHRPISHSLRDSIPELFHIDPRRKIGLHKHRAILISLAELSWQVVRQRYLEVDDRKTMWTSCCCELERCSIPEEWLPKVHIGESGRIYYSTRVFAAILTSSISLINLPSLNCIIHS